MAKLFSFGDVKNHPHRSGFDLANKNLFSAKVGELLPVYAKRCMPGDKFPLDHQHFTRTTEVNTAAYTRIKEYFDWYFVPYRLINKNLPQALMNMQDNPVTAVSLQANKTVPKYLPYTSLQNISNFLFKSVPAIGATGSIKNQFGFDACACSVKLLQYLRYGNIMDPALTGDVSKARITDTASFSLKYLVNVNVTLDFLLAYQKIYADHYRFTQWEKNEPFTYNVDYYTDGDLLSTIATAKIKEYMSANNIFTLRYCNWKKDLFFGVMPSPQLGTVASISMSDTRVYGQSKDGSSKFDLDGTISKVSGQSYGTVQVGVPTYPLTTQTGVFLTTSPEFSVIQLRIAEAAQRYKEVSQCADQDYISQVRAHFGVSLSPALSDQCRYIGGTSSTLDISEVVNQNLADDNSEASIKGKGIGTSTGHQFFETDEHGVLMCLYHAVPIMDYNITGPDLQLLETQTTDLPIPEYDSIGMQSLPMIALFNANITGTILGTLTAQALQNSILGYVPRYIQYKTSIDVVNGAFLTTRRNWVSCLDPQILNDWFGSSLKIEDGVYKINYNFFKVNPRIIDNVFVSKCTDQWDSDQLQVNVFFDVKAVRNLDFSGMPY